MGSFKRGGTPKKNLHGIQGTCVDVRPHSLENQIDSPTIYFLAELSIEPSPPITITHPGVSTRRLTEATSSYISGNEDEGLASSEIWKQTETLVNIVYSMC